MLWRKRTEEIGLIGEPLPFTPVHDDITSGVPRIILWEFFYISKQSKRRGWVPDNQDPRGFGNSDNMKTISALLAICEGNPPVTLTKGPLMRSLIFFFDGSLNKLNKHVIWDAIKLVWRHWHVDRSMNHMC